MLAIIHYASVGGAPRHTIFISMHVYADVSRAMCPYTPKPEIARVDWRGYVTAAQTKWRTTLCGLKKKTGR